MAEMSLKSLMQQRRNQLFVGRKQECSSFHAFIKEDEVSILNIYGVGGIGKSTLLERYMSICRDQHIPAGVIDGKENALMVAIVGGQRIYSAIKMLASFVQQFAHDNSNDNFFKEFHEEVRELHKLVAKLENRDAEEEDSSINPTTKEFIAQSAGGIIGGVVGNIPGAIVGAAVGTIGEHIIEKLGRTVRNLKRYKLSKDEVDRCLHAEEKVTSAFVKAVNQMAKTTQKKIILMFDTYEEMGSIDAWLRNLLLSNLCEMVAIVLSGRDPLSDKWNDWVELTQKCELRPLSEEEATLYLAKRRVTETATVNNLLTLTGCLPWALTLVTEIKSGSPRLNESLTVSSLGRRVVERFFSQIADQHLREVIEASSLALTFDADLLATMLGRDVSQQVRELKTFSFVEMNDKHRLSLNDTFREFVLDKLRQERPSTMLKWNQQAVKYYEELLQIAPFQDKFGLIWDYLHHWYFGDREAHNLLIGMKPRKGGIEIRTATEEDLASILQVDWAAFPHPEDRFQIEQIVGLYHINSDIFTIARDIETGEIIGYSCIVPMKREFARRFEEGSLNIQDVLAPTVLPSHENPVLVDYMLDTLALRNPNDLYIGALLIRHLGRLIAKARKLYSIVSSDYGRKLMKKLKFTHTGSVVLGENVVHDFYVSCLYNSTNLSPIVSVLPKEPIKMQHICADCLYQWCYEWDKHVERHQPK